MVQPFIPPRRHSAGEYPAVVPPEPRAAASSMGADISAIAELLQEFRKGQEQQLAAHENQVRVAVMAMKGSAESAAMTLTKRSVKASRLVAIIASLAGVGYAAFDMGHDRFVSGARQEAVDAADVVKSEAEVLHERVDATEKAQTRMAGELEDVGRKVDQVAEDVSAIADALKPRAKRGAR